MQKSRGFKTRKSVRPRQPRGGLAVKKVRAGLGLVTTAPIRKGAFIIEYFGPYITNEEADKRLGRYLFEINSRFTVDGKSRANIARYINHSCRPNCEVAIRDCRIYICAKQAIKAGEELSYDYGKDYFEEFIRPRGCRCEKCRILPKKQHQRKHQKRKK